MAKEENSEIQTSISAATAADQVITDCRCILNSCRKIFIAIIYLLVIVHEDFFQSRLLDGDIGDLYFADLVHDRIDVALVEEAHCAIMVLQIGHARDVEVRGIEAVGHHLHLLVVIPLQGADICDFDDPALFDDGDAVAHALHLAQDVR